MKRMNVLIATTVVFLLASCAKRQEETEKIKAVPTNNQAALLSSSYSQSAHPHPDVSKYCVDGSVWVMVSYYNGAWGGQQLDPNGKPIPCSSPK